MPMILIFEALGEMNTPDRFGFNSRSDGALMHHIDISFFPFENSLARAFVCLEITLHDNCL